MNLTSFTVFSFVKKIYIIYINRLTGEKRRNLRFNLLFELSFYLSSVVI